jgi:hypothetical protein
MCLNKCLPDKHFHLTTCFLELGSSTREMIWFVGKNIVPDLVVGKNASNHSEIKKNHVLI